jgi:hypothetical protein
MASPTSIASIKQASVALDNYTNLIFNAVSLPTPPVTTADHRTLKRHSPTDWEDDAIHTPKASLRALSIPTPPASTAGTDSRPVYKRLRLIIPQPEPSKENERKLATRRAAAERWKPKLQRPPPKGKEISAAYNLKLLRHYTRHSTPPAPNFIKPRIDTSPRVSRLLKQFPLLSTPITPAAATPTQDAIEILQANKRITKSESAQRLAWQSFSATEKDRVDRGREAMMESGLVVADLWKEMDGAANQLPEWKKLHTSRFAREKSRPKEVRK